MGNLLTNLELFALFPASGLSLDAGTRKMIRHHDRSTVGVLGVLYVAHNNVY